MTIEEKITELYNQGKAFIESVKESVGDGKLSLAEIWNILCTFIHLAENIIDIPKQGATKQQIVMQLWDAADKEFNLVYTLSSYIPDKIKIKWWMFNITIPLFPEKAINTIISKVIIPAMVIMANKIGWGK